MPAPTLTAPKYFDPAESDSEEVSADACVYGGTSAGIIAAVQLARCGRSVTLIAPEAHLGGMTAGGLSLTDIGNKHVIGGLSREFYRRAGQHYGVAEEWRFEPHVASAVFTALLAGTDVRVHPNQFLDTVRCERGNLTALRTLSGLTVRARMFIDATYEGDLLAAAGASHTVGREGNSRYGETLNGAQIHATHQFAYPVDPYVVAGAPGSGLLPGIEAGEVLPGAGDHRVQAYNFRMCLTRRADNRVPFSRPAAYQESHYELLARHLGGGWNEAFHKFDPIRGEKTDTNNHGPVSTDFIGQNHAWPAGDYATREKIFQAHVNYQQGLMWFLSHHPRTPASIRDPMGEWGLARDEFAATGHWPHQLYVREARRLVGDVVMTEQHCTGRTVVDDSVGLAAYGMDSHHCRRFVRDGRVWNEGDVQVAGFKPYPISYRALVPRRGECSNLLVPVCVSASHIAFGSIRMEPVFMVLGQSAALAADLALGDKCAVQDLPYPALRERLLAAGQVLRPAAGAAVPNEIV
jgi:hypothetical protein